MCNMAVMRRMTCVICSLIFVVVFGLVCGCKEERAARGDARPPGGKGEEGPAKHVEVMTVAKQPIERTVTALGWLKAKQEVVLSAKVSGRVQEIAVDIGSTVKAGQVIARIDPRDYELRVRQAEAALAQTRARLGLPPTGGPDIIDPENVNSVKEAKAVFEEARLNRERAVNLEKDQLIAKSEFDAAEAAYKVAMSRYQSALDDARLRQAALAERRAELDFAREQLIDATILAPFDGVIQVRQANLGAYLREGDPVTTLVQVDPLRLHLEVPERDAARIAPGQDVRFSITGQSAERKATISRISPALDRDSRILVVEADVPNDGSLPAGAFAQAHVVVEADSPALIVPPESIRTFAGVQKVYTMENGRAVEKEIATGARTSTWVEVLSGLKEGDRVVLAPNGLRTGDLLAVKEGEKSSAARGDARPTDPRLPVPSS